MRSATWNVNSLRVRVPQVLEWLGRNPVDVLALQETKLTDELFPQEQFTALGYQVRCSGQKSFRFEDPARRVLAATVAAVRVINLYVPNGQAVGSDKCAYKLRRLCALRGWLGEELKQPPRLVALGDFNIAPAPSLRRRPGHARRCLHVSEPERQALREIIDLNLVDVFRQFEQPPQTFSWWDYRTLGSGATTGCASRAARCGAPLAPRPGHRRFHNAWLNEDDAVPGAKVCAASHRSQHGGA